MSRSPDECFVVAVDGGSSSTRALVGNQTGEVVGVGVGGPTGLFTDEAGLRRLEGALRAAIGGALKSAGVSADRVATAFLGLTGVFDEQDDGRKASDIAWHLLPRARIHVRGDAAPAFLAASCGLPGVLVYSGTGSIAYGVDDRGNQVRSGGWGYLVDDRGGGFRIGIEALEAVFRQSDGRGPETKLSEVVLAHFAAVDPGALLRLIYLDKVLDRARVAALVPLVRSAADDGDTVARELLAEAAHRLVELAQAVGRRLPGLYGGRIYPAGGVFRAGPWLREPFDSELAVEMPEAVVCEPAFPPVVGSYLMALQHSGRLLDDRVLGGIRRTRRKWEELEPS
ncbi:MAG: BadF/BadG/BcrA/BcrD ATPase family protein [Trueperaceae bacterium]